MAVGGTVSTPIFKQDGQYLTFTVESAAVTLGQVVATYSTTSPATVTVAGAGDLGIIGVAVSGNRISRTATADTVEIGDKVTVCTRGVCNCVVAAAGSTFGASQIAGAAGTVTDASTATYVSDLRGQLGVALKTGTTGEVIPVLLTIR